jgi:isopentenyldiphosphate isomerase
MDWKNSAAIVPTRAFSLFIFNHFQHILLHSFVRLKQVFDMNTEV